ncbi:MAG: hypothetical protein QOD77_1276 [Thermoplasmata archaeon]|jgi:hypothetical protein|nr:hypothetical protein [Thermoplasmata archaeon]
MNKLWVTAVLAVLLAGCGGSVEDSTTTTAATVRTGPPSTGPCKHLYQPSTQGQVLVEVRLSREAEDQHFIGRLVRIENNTPITEAEADVQVAGSCVRAEIPRAGNYMVSVRTPDNYTGGENCYWSGATSRFDFDAQAYKELPATLNFQCAHT